MVECSGSHGTAGDERALLNMTGLSQEDLSDMELMKIENQINICRQKF